MHNYQYIITHNTLMGITAAHTTSCKRTAATTETHHQGHLTNLEMKLPTHSPWEPNPPQTPTHSAMKALTYGRPQCYLEALLLQSSIFFLAAGLAFISLFRHVVCGFLQLTTVFLHSLLSSSCSGSCCFYLPSSSIFYLLPAQEAVASIFHLHLSSNLPAQEVVCFYLQIFIFRL